MAKAREIPGLRPDMTYADAAAITVRVRAQELVDHSDGVLDTSDIERVHAMRVATRRLRAVLEIHAACFPQHEFKPVLRDVKALADALGARRDPDVQLAAIDAFARELGEGEGPGIAIFAQELREEQQRGNAVLADALEQMEASDLAGRLATLADLALGIPAHEHDEDQDVAPEPVAHANANVHVLAPEPAAQADAAEYVSPREPAAEAAVAIGVTPVAEAVTVAPVSTALAVADPEPPSRRPGLLRFLRRGR